LKDIAIEEKLTAAIHWMEKISTNKSGQIAPKKIAMETRR
jgi:hypothetical protein